MLGLRRESRLDKARKTLREVVAYAEDVARDERLRADIRNAASHGAKASDRIAKDVNGAGITRRLADDKKLRRNLRAMLDDLDDASDRVRGRTKHRLRNALLVVSGVVALVALLPKTRDVLSDSMSEGLAAPDGQVAPTL